MLSCLALHSISGYLPLWLRRRAPGTLSALNGSFRRILRVEDKSERTVKSYTVAVRLFADFLAERGHPLTSRRLLGEVQYSCPWTGRDRALRPAGTAP